LSLSTWLFIAAIIASMAMLAIWYVGQRAKEEGKNTKMLSLLRRQHRSFALYNLGTSALYLLLAGASRVESLGASNGVQTGRGVLTLALVLLVAGCIAGVSIMSMRSWSQVVSYSLHVRVGCQVHEYTAPSSPRSVNLKGQGNRKGQYISMKRIEKKRMGVGAQFIAPNTHQPKGSKRTESLVEVID
jgi:hypothetical protein